MPPHSHQDYYLSLSHRWGGAKVLQTVMGDPPGTPNGKRGTYSEFQSAIPMASMPKTFRDAVQVTRALGFRYIWIDSLCIVQDRPSDWEAEAKKMGSYYRNAHVTLVAGSAVSADSGLFYPIEGLAAPCHLGSVSLELPNCRHHGAEPHTFPLFAREPQMVRSDYGDGPKPPSTLDDRAWVLQEEVLSPRSLIFTEKGLHWECTNLSASELHPHGSEYQYTRSLSPRDPEPYGGEVFITTYRTYAQRFKRLLLKDRNFMNSAADPLVRAIRSRIPVALDEVLSEVAALRHAKSQMPSPNSGSTSKEMRMVTSRVILPEKHHQNCKVDEEHRDLRGSTSRPPSPQPAPASSFLAGTISDHCFIWHQLAEDYSARELTRESDRLIAIQGLVSMLNEARRDQYYAGLWGRTLREDILWRTDDGRTRMQHLCECIPQREWHYRELRPRREPAESGTSQAVAPSWSWASADQGVVFMKALETFDTLEEFFRPLHIVMDDNTAVFNVRGRLTIEGVLRPIGLAPSDEELPYREMYVFILRFCEEKNQANSPIRSRGMTYDPSDPSKKELGVWHPDRRTTRTGVVVCVPLVMLPPVNGAAGRDETMGEIQCMVLEPTENCRLRNKASKLLEFRRIGIATFTSEHRAFLGLGKSQRMKDRRAWDVRVKEWTRKPVAIDII